MDMVDVGCHERHLASVILSMWERPFFQGIMDNRRTRVTCNLDT